jgi:hypothetical protein
MSLCNWAAVLPIVVVVWLLAALLLYYSKH